MFGTGLFASFIFFMVRVAIDVAALGFFLSVRVVKTMILLRVLIVGCLLAPLVGWAGDVGTVIALSGEVGVISASGQTRALHKGAAIGQSETLVTGRKGRIDVRFSDGALVQLRPESQFRIDEYSYSVAAPGKANGVKTDSNDKGLFSLIKGGFRTITGLLGKMRRSHYAVVTPTATIGIRGTEYSATLDEGLDVSVTQGEITLDNNAGSFSVSAGQSAHVADANSAPSYRQAVEAARGAARVGAGQGGGAVQINGNTRIEVSTENTQAVAVGQGNRAVNQAGVIGGD